jgi:hypothetical protein
MGASDIWRVDETRTVVWRLIHAAGERGIGRKELIDGTGKSGTAVDWHLVHMARDGYIKRPPGISHALWMAGPKLPPIDGVVLDLALEEVDDCPAGVSSDVLCAVIGCSLHLLEKALAPAEADGRLERIRMPLAYGGGVGWCRPGLADALQPPPQRMAAQDMQHEHVRLPVREVDIDRIHRQPRGERFQCELVAGRLQLTSGPLHYELSAEHTQKLLQALTPHILRLARDE